MNSILDVLESTIQNEILYIVESEEMSLDDLTNYCCVRNANVLNNPSEEEVKAEVQRLVNEKKLYVIKNDYYSYDSKKAKKDREKRQAVEPVAVEPVAVEPVAVEPVAVEPLAVEPCQVCVCSYFESTRCGRC
jgi:hypothetical protein